MPLPVIVGAGLAAVLGITGRTIIIWLVRGMAMMFAARLGSWIGAAMAWFGLQWATQKYAVGPLLDQIRSVASGLSGEALMWLGFLQFDRALTMVLSAVSIRFALQSGRAFLERI